MRKVFLIILRICGSGLVYKADDYVYSSAIDYSGQKGLVSDVVVFRMW
jgi:hypothetical protein